MKQKFGFFTFFYCLGHTLIPCQNAIANPCPPLKIALSSNIYCLICAKKPPCLHQHFHTNTRRIRKNDVTIVEFAPPNWVVERIGE
jgi:hypothetical protein